MSRFFHLHRPVRGCAAAAAIIVTTVFFFGAGSSARAADTQPADLSTAIMRVAKDTIPAVVHIEVTERQEVANPLLPFENDPFFHYFFGSPNMPKKFKRELKGLGTGMIIDAEGHILTNNHVVGGANKILVQLADGRSYTEKSVKLIGTDPKTDLAVIQVLTKERLPYVTFGDSDKADVGQWVVAIGHPRGLDQTVTQGIISAKHRRGISDPSSYQDYLQTDAAINPGNSGGPLLDLYGNVIGINAAIASESGGFEGIGFAIPSNMAVHISRDLIAHGKVTRGWIGISIQDLTPELAKSFGLSLPKGVLVADTVKGGPADAAGIRRGDIIVGYRNREISDSSALRDDVAASAVGSEASVSLLRNGKKQELTVKVANLEDENKKLTASLKEKFGIQVSPVTAKEAEKYGLESSTGVVIAWVSPKGPFGRAGLEVGDIILQINNQAVDGPDVFAAMLDALPRKQAVPFLVVDHRNGQTGYVQLQVR